MRKVHLVWVLLALLPVSGCATTSESVRYDDNKVYAPTNANDVKIFHSKPSGREYAELGEVKVISNNFVANALLGVGSQLGLMDDQKTFDQKLRVEASKLGGNAVIILKDEITKIGSSENQSEKNPYTNQTNTQSYDQRRREVVAMAIRLT